MSNIRRPRVGGGRADLSHTRREYAVVLPVFARDHDYDSAKAYDGFLVGELNALLGKADMPAFIHHHDAEPPFMICPSCARLPMHIKDVAPHWSVAKIDFIYECSECGAEIKQTVTKPELVSSVH